MAEKKWIAGAISEEHKGEFSAAAKSHGMTTRAYAEMVLKRGSKASAHRKRQARMAKTLMGMHK